MTVPVASVEVFSFSVFYSHLRIRAFLHAAPRPEVSDRQQARTIGVRLLFKGRAVKHKTECEWQDGGWNLVLEALVERSSLFQDSWLVVTEAAGSWRIALSELSAGAARRGPPSLAGPFKQMVRDFVRTEPLIRPRMLDIGGRARSGIERRGDYPECDVTVLDIHPDPSVDIVGDAHELSLHFAPETFDFALCVSVFEHLLMPWKAVIEMNKVLKTGAWVLIHTHQTIGMHDLPWDFYRFSDTSWHGLFNGSTGFEVVQTAMSQFMHVVPQAWTPAYESAEQSGGFEGSSAIVRKTRPTYLDWDVRLLDVLNSAYPRHQDGSRK